MSQSCCNCFEENATMKCLDCPKIDMFFCDDCSSFHTKVKQFKSHTLVRSSPLRYICGNCDSNSASHSCKQCTGKESYLCEDCSAFHTRVKQFKHHELCALSDASSEHDAMKCSSPFAAVFEYVSHYAESLQDMLLVEGNNTGILYALGIALVIHVLCKFVFKQNSMVLYLLLVVAAVVWVNKRNSSSAVSYPLSIPSSSVQSTGRGTVSNTGGRSLDPTATHGNHRSNDRFNSFNDPDLNLNARVQKNNFNGSIRSEFDSGNGRVDGKKAHKKGPNVTHGVQCGVGKFSTSGFGSLRDGPSSSRSSSVGGFDNSQQHSTSSLSSSTSATLQKKHTKAAGGSLSSVGSGGSGSGGGNVSSMKGGVDQSVRTDRQHNGSVDSSVANGDEDPVVNEFWHESAVASGKPAAFRVRTGRTYKPRVKAKS